MLTLRVATFIEVFDKGSLYLFGSRVDDRLKGGDIDLYIQPEQPTNLAEKRLNFIAKLYRQLGEQKIDVVIQRRQPKLIDRIATEQGILLCQRH
ncbi:hypothetical protein D5085_07505 [Ectothiorhodospiraceae bacterium BW-2]|nr:hypothetical protein D5085_07505 [Ectothiorhodospiraceae bacterium BW-2]